MSNLVLVCCTFCCINKPSLFFLLLNSEEGPLPMNSSSSRHALIGGVAYGGYARKVRTIFSIHAHLVELYEAVFGWRFFGGFIKGNGMISLHIPLCLVLRKSIHEALDQIQPWYEWISPIYFLVIHFCNFFPSDSRTNTNFNGIPEWSCSNWGPSRVSSYGTNRSPCFGWNCQMLWYQSVCFLAHPLLNGE